MKNKTIATWLALLLGPIGLHRFYLRGWGDGLGWIMPVPTLLGAYGVLRLWHLGVDDMLGWLLAPVLGFVIAACALTAIVYGLMPAERWNARFNATADPQTTSGMTNWLTVVGLVAALLVGTTALMSSIAFGFQHFFEYQVRQANERPS